MNANELMIGFKYIPQYENLYSIDRSGNVFSHISGKFLKPHPNHRGYLMVDLYKDGKVKKGVIHRLVAITFIDNPNNLPCINHKDEDKFNNSVNNLEWCSYSYNVRYNNNIRRMIDTRNSNCSRGCEKQVYQYDLNGVLIKVWSSLKSIQRELGYKATNISSYCLGKYNKKSAYGYKWSYNPI